MWSVACGELKSDTFAMDFDEILEERNVPKTNYRLGVLFLDA